MGAMGALWLIATIHHVYLARRLPPPASGQTRQRAYAGLPKT